MRAPAILQGTSTTRPTFVVRAAPKPAHATTPVQAVEQALKQMAPQIAQADGPPSTPESSSRGFGAVKPAKTKPSGAKKGRKANKGGPVSGGQLDVVQVQDWGSGEQADLGELKIKNMERLIGRPVAPTQQLTGPASASEPEALPVATQQGLNQQELGNTQQKQQQQRKQQQVPSLGLYEQLCQEMALAEKRGALAIAGPAPPPLQHWSFTPARYLQYLTDCLAVHQALETALQACRGSDGVAVPQPALIAALQGFPGCGLERAACIKHDLQVLSKLHPKHVPAQVSIMAQTHASQLLRFGRDVQPWVAQQGKAGPRSEGEHKVQEEVETTGRNAASSLLAHAFAVYVLHAAGGMRFGAVAVEKLGLLNKQAAKFYHSYPSHVKEPLDVLRKVLDGADASGSGSLDPLERSAVIAVLPTAVRNASMLFTALAYID